MPLRRLFSLLLVLLLCVAAPARAGVTYTFAGGKVEGCDLAGKTYTCPALPLPNWDDKVVIAGGYTVTAKGDVNFGYNHGLSMSGGAVLNISGNLDIGNISPSLLQVNGATFIAGGKFSFGAQSQTIVANITANTMSLGTGSQAKVTGTINAKGDIAIASNTTIVGSVSGAAITTNSTVSITGDVTATKSFTLCSACTVNGNIKTPVFEAQSSSGTVNGNVDASTSVSLGHAVVINGDVTTGELTMYDTDAIINGDATVEHATLQYHDRVRDTITCSKGSTPGKCDCVTNNSAYDVRPTIRTSGNGPYCEGKASPLDHFVIGHDQTAGVCTKSSVSVTACANAACTSTYGSGTTVYLQPTQQRIDIGSTGIATASVQMPPGSVTLSLTSGASSGTLSSTCKVNGTGATSNCKVQVNDASLALAVNAAANAGKSPASDNTFTAADETARVPLEVSALVYNSASQACVPLFKGVSRNVVFSYAYNNPGSGTLPIAVNGQSFARTASATVSLAFNDQGKASTTLSYADAGQLKLDARVDGTDTNASGSVLAIAAPAVFKVEFAGLPATTATPRPKAGTPFTIKVTALNASRPAAATPNFGKEAQPVYVQLAGSACPLKGSNGFVPPTANPAVAAGVQTFAPAAGDANGKPRMDEVGALDVAATLAAGYFGTAYQPTGSTNTAGANACSGASGSFVPAYFQVDADAAWDRKAKPAGVALNQYYSAEPKIKLTLTAKNLLNATTVNYADGLAARDLDLTALDSAGAVIPATTGQLQNTQAACKSGSGKLVCAEHFKLGIASWSDGSFKFKPAKLAPLTLSVRATDTDGASSSASPATPKEPSLQVRSGRVRIASGYASAGATLALPVRVEYWDGRNWMRNVEDAHPITFAPAAFSLASVSLDGTTAAKVDIAAGAGELRLTPPSRTSGYVDVALNLGSLATDNSCVTNRKATTGAAMPFLRFADPACSAAAARDDPSARATFGVFTPEAKRMIHVREVFR